MFPCFNNQPLASLYGHAVPQASTLSQDAYAKFAYATCNDDVQTFLIVVEKVGKFPILRGCRNRRSLDLETPVVLRLARLARIS